jgi:hypothetical protein
MPRTTRVSTLSLDEVKQENEQKLQDRKESRRAMKEDRLYWKKQYEKKLEKVKEELKHADDVLPYPEKGIVLTMKFEGDLSKCFERVVYSSASKAFAKAAELIKGANEKIQAEVNDEKIKHSDAYYQDVFFGYLCDLDMSEFKHLLENEADPEIKKYINVLYMRRWHILIEADARSKYF